MVKEQIVSKKRVADHGEVFTGEKEVNAMLDLVKQETERIDSRFLEPACGKGAFLQEILKRKLAVVKSVYEKSICEYEKYAISAVSSIYGIDILEDNVIDCRNILLNTFLNEYKSIFNKECSAEYKKVIEFLLHQNIVWGDALSLKRIDNPNEAIVFSKWSFIGRNIKRSDFIFENLINPSSNGTLFFADNGKDVFLPKAIRNFPLTNYLRIADVK